MVATAIAAEVSGAIRDLSTGMEARRRTFGTSVRGLVSTSAAVGESSRARIAREVQVPPAQVLSWMASAFAASASFLNAGAGHAEADVVCGIADWAIVDRALTRC